MPGIADETSRLPFFLLSALCLAAATPVAGKAPCPEPGVWHWVESRYSDGSHVAPEEPSRYALRLRPDGALEATLDCNQGSGRWEVGRAGRTRIEILTSTQAACPPASLAERFAPVAVPATIFPPTRPEPGCNSAVIHGPRRNTRAKAPNRQA